MDFSKVWDGMQKALSTSAGQFVLAIIAAIVGGIILNWLARAFSPGGKLLFSLAAMLLAAFGAVGTAAVYAATGIPNYILWTAASLVFLIISLLYGLVALFQLLAQFGQAQAEKIKEQAREEERDNIAIRQARISNKLVDKRHDYENM